MNLDEVLSGDGYRKIPLKIGAVGHFHADGTLNGHPVDILLDTGAASTVMSLALARSLGLSLNKLERQGGGVGVAQLDLFKVEDAMLEIHACAIRPKALIAMDLSHVTEALARRGLNPVVEVVVGVDVFSAQAAIIDYGGCALFLRAPE